MLELSERQDTFVDIVGDEASHWMVYLMGLKYEYTGVRPPTLPLILLISDRHLLTGSCDVLCVRLNAVSHTIIILRDLVGI